MARNMRRGLCVWAVLAASAAWATTPADAAVVARRTVGVVAPPVCVAPVRVHGRATVHRGATAVFPTPLRPGAGVAHVGGTARVRW